MNKTTSVDFARATLAARNPLIKRGNSPSGLRQCARRSALRGHARDIERV
jgi:hypothetical protein